MNIAITGALGRLGRYVVAAFTPHHTVRLIDLGPPTECHQADVRDLSSLVTAFRDTEVVIHLGAIDKSVATDDSATMQVNAMGTWNVFEAARQTGVRRIVQCSSSSAIGVDQTNPTIPPAYLPIDEQHPTRPTDAYGLSKLCGERIAESFSRQGLEAIVIRPCFVSFPEQADFMAGKPGPAGRSEPPPYLRAYVGPEDCARGFLAAATIPYGGFETFFLAAADTFATESTVPRLEALYGTTIPLRDPALYRDNPRASPISHAAAQTRLGWAPSTQWSLNGK
jgi:UDP-glucose 4-epimerase